MPKPFDSELIAKAKEQVDFQREHYIKKHADDDHWVDLARDANVTLPMFYVRPSDAGVKGLLRKLGLSWLHYIEAYGWETTADFERLNPKFSMRPLAGLILELWDERKRTLESLEAAAYHRGLTKGDGQAKPTKYPRGVAKVRRAPLKPVAES